MVKGSGHKSLNILIPYPDNDSPPSSLIHAPPTFLAANLHVFSARTPCAVLDILTPPYSPSEGIDCTYYRELSLPSNPGDLVLLEVRVQGGCMTFTTTHLLLQPRRPFHSPRHSQFRTQNSKASVCENRSKKDAMQLGIQN